MGCCRFELDGVAPLNVHAHVVGHCVLKSLKLIDVPVAMLVFEVVKSETGIAVVLQEPTLMSSK